MLLILIFKNVAVDGLQVAKFFSSNMVLQEAPATNNVFGTSLGKQVKVHVGCVDGSTEDVEVETVSSIANSTMRSISRIKMTSGQL